MDKIERLLGKLSQADGVSGYEADVRQILKPLLAPFGEVIQDRLGSLICKVPGSSGEPRIMMAAHMDEVGFVVKEITDSGFVKFLQVGDWDNQHLMGQRVHIETKNGRVLGNIAGKPSFLMDEKERKKVQDKLEMFVDIGAASRQEVEQAGITLGDPIIPVSEFSILSPKPKTYMGKALDNRLGVALLVTLLNKIGVNHPNMIYAVATTQEEVGTRGAKTSANRVKPDIAISIDTSPAGDTPGVDPNKSASQLALGQGPVIVAYDTSMIPNRGLRDFVLKVAKEEQIAVQQTVVEVGGFDGESIATSEEGVLTLNVAFPARHVHTSNTISRRSDFDAMLKLLTAVVKQLDKKTFKKMTA